MAWDRNEEIAAYNRVRLEQYHADARERIRLASAAAENVAKALATLNGGAIIALFTLFGHVNGLGVKFERLTQSFACYSAGLVFTILLGIFIYLTHEARFDGERALAQETYRVISGAPGKPITVPESHLKGALPFLGLTASFLALLCFVGGSALALLAVRL